MKKAKGLTIAELPKMVMELYEKVSNLEVMLGDAKLWISAYEAAQILPYSSDRILQDIKEAEEKRIYGLTPNLVYGVHYCNTSNTQKPAYKVHRIEYAKWALQPPDTRLVQP